MSYELSGETFLDFAFKKLCLKSYLRDSVTTLEYDL